MSKKLDKYQSSSKKLIILLTFEEFSIELYRMNIKIDCCHRVIGILQRPRLQLHIITKYLTNYYKGGYFTEYILLANHKINNGLIK